MNLFKKTKSLWMLGAKRVAKGTPGAILTRTESTKWHISIDRKHVPLHQNKKVAESMAAQLLGQKAGGKLGVLVVGRDDERRKPLSELLGEWEKAIEMKGSSTEHASLLCVRVRKVFNGCDFERVRDLDAEKAYQFIGGLMAKWGGGVEKSASAHTKNFYLAGLKQFARWLVRRKVIQDNPFLDLEPWDVKKDRRLDRRELTAEELESLISTTEGGGIVRGKLSPVARSWLYRIAVFTGLRAKELHSLCPVNFDLTNAEVIVPGKYTKNGDPARQPLPPALLPLLSSWLKDIPLSSPCRPGKWKANNHAGQMLKADLEAAGVPYVKDGLFADFHSLRHSYISKLIRSGANLKVAQALARHSTITLTADRYGHLADGEKRGAVAALGMLGCIPDASTEEAEEERPRNAGELCDGPSVSKTDMGASPSRVRIPPSPLEQITSNRCKIP